MSQPTVLATHLYPSQQEFIRRATIVRKQPLMGPFSQMAVGLMHHVQPKRLARISAQMAKVSIVTGGEDHLPIIIELVFSHATGRACPVSWGRSWDSCSMVFITYLWCANNSNSSTWSFLTAQPPVCSHSCTSCTAAISPVISMHPCSLKPSCSHS